MTKPLPSHNLFYFFRVLPGSENTHHPDPLYFFFDPENDQVSPFRDKTVGSFITTDTMQV